MGKVHSVSKPCANVTFVVNRFATEVGNVSHTTAKIYHIS